MTHAVYLLAAGALAGLLSGLFGVGGGLIIVPILGAIFTALAFSGQHIMHMALGTSLASIAFTSLSSARAHHAQSNVDWTTFRKMAGGIVVGTFSGTLLAATLATFWLKIIFVFFLLIVAVRLALDLAPDPARELPGWPATSVVGSIIGALSSLVGIGGGSLTVPFLIHCNVPVKRAIGTSAAVGLPIALAGSAGYMLHGWHTPQLPAYSLGYVYLPALFAIAAMSMLTAPLGARLARRLPPLLLKRAFAALLLLVGGKMLWGLG